MRNIHPTYTPSPSGLMDFEPVSIDSARAALDELPDGVEVLLDSSYWTKVRRAPLPTDRALTGRAMEWFGALPEDLRPQSTCDRYARIINSLAAAWNDPHARSKLFDSLLNDRRPGRRGFPIEVEREISALCLYASALTQ